MRRRPVLKLLAACPAAVACRADGSPERTGPDEGPVAARSDAVGDLGTVPARWRGHFDVGAHVPFAGTPNDGDVPQSFAAFAARAPIVTSARRRIDLLPIGSFPRGFAVDPEGTRLVRSPPLAMLTDVLRAWFGLPVRELPALADDRLESLPHRTRDGVRQVDAAAIVRVLRADHLDAATASVLALTLRDLWSGDAAWVYGLASATERAGVHSMLRYDPGFASVDARGSDFEHVILSRSVRVLIHETMHMLGVTHCLHWRCIMNPTSSLADVDALPLRACPVCLRKLWHATGVDLDRRRAALRAQWTAFGL